MKSRVVTLLACALAFTAPLTSKAATGGAGSDGESAAFHSLRAPVPPFECEAYVAYDLDQELPGYILPTAAGARTCIPFTSVAEQPPEGYRGDFYVDEFSDAQLRKRWEASRGGTSPIVAGGLLWVYDPSGALLAYRPGSGRRVASLPAGPGHWNSPVPGVGVIALPEGDANQHTEDGVLNLYARS